MPICTKVKFKTKEAALKRSSEICRNKKGDKKAYLPKFAYHCSNCGSYHLTHVPPKVWRKKYSPESGYTPRWLQQEVNYWEENL